MLNSQLRHYLALLVSLIILSDFGGSAIKLNCDGGYDIVIGVEPNVVEPLNDGSFINEIRAGVDAFSAELWKATNQRFYINSVDVLIPANWWTFHNAETATWQTLLNSEIRVTHDVAAPTVVNPNPCGSAGLYIDLPDSFFKIPRGGKYGPVGKALVNLWARYRFGVWEEHGIPGDTQFPYFHSRPSFEPHWEATGCSNEEIQGTFQTIDGDISDRCDPYGTDIPADDCRFIPSPTSAANSSLLHFHWLDSVTQFCDSKTHDMLAPNRQNLFCGHRSVWEVIRETDDYKSTKSFTESVSRPKFRVLKDSRVPQLYVLLDRGRTVTPEPVLKDIRKSLIKLVNAPSIEKVNIAVGTYPHANQGKDHYYVKEEIGWAPIDQVINDLEGVFESATDPSGPVIRDFGLAIQEVAEKVKQRNHLAGTIILVIKRGAGPNIFDKITHEQEVIANIKEDSRITVFAIETQQGDQTPYTNIQSLVQATSGRYHLINDTMNTERKLDGILGLVQEILEQPSIMNSLSSWVTQKQYTTPQEEIEIPIYDSINHVKVHLTTNKHMLASDISLEQVSGDHQSVQRTEKFEWDESADLSRRIVFTYIIRNPSPGSVWRLKHGCHSEKLTECRFFLVVTAQLDNPTPRQSIQDFHFFNGQSINIDISTSAEHNYLDMSRHGMKIVPFAIFAKIEMNQQRILGLENVTALVRLGGDHDSHIGIWTVELRDDGRGVPDVSAHDGIYSGVFTPPEDGLYQISVHASGVSNANALNGGSSFQDVRIVNQAGSLIAKDQYNFGCRNSSKPRCVSAVPLGSFSRVMDMMSTVAVENAATFKPGKPMKILDFTATTGPNFAVQFGFTSPKLLGSDASPEEFRIYMAPHPDNFLGSTDMTKLLIQSIGQPSGEYVTINFNAGQQAIPYYAVEAFYGGQKGGPSNVIGVVPYEHEPIIPSTTTTTNNPVTSTTEIPSTTVSPTTEPSTTPTTALTTPVWPTEPTTTDFPYSTTTEESEETDPEVTSTTTTTIRPETSTAIPSSSTTTSLPSSTTTLPPITSSDITDPIISSSTTTPPPDEDETTTTTPEPSLPPISSTSTELPSSTSTTTEPPSPSSTSTEAPSSTSTSTESPPITSDITDISSSTTTPQPLSSTTEEPNPSSSTTTTWEPSISTSTSENPSSTSTTEPPVSSSTETSSTTTSESPSSSTTTEPPVSSSTTEASSTSTSENPSSSTTTESPVSSTTEVSSTSTTSENPSSSSTTEPPFSSSTTEVSSTSTSENPSSSSTTELPSSSSTTETSSTSTSENPISSSTTTESPISSSTTEISSTTTSENPSSSSTSTEPPVSSTTETSSTTTSENPSSSSTSTESSVSSSTTEVSSTSTSESPSPSSTSSTESSVSSTTTESVTSSETPSSESPVVSSSSTHSTSEQASSSTSETNAAPTNLLFSPILLVTLAFNIIFLNQRLLS